MQVQAQIEQRLRQALNPQHLVLVNESQMHNVPPGSESHFNAVIVSEAFRERSLVERHRCVYAAIGEQLRSSVHAFTMKTLTPAEWHAKSKQVDNPPPRCRGGEKRP